MIEDKGVYPPYETFNLNDIIIPRFELKAGVQAILENSLNPDTSYIIVPFLDGSIHSRRVAVPRVLAGFLLEDFNDWLLQRSSHTTPKAPSKFFLAGRHLLNINRVTGLATISGLSVSIPTVEGEKHHTFDRGEGRRVEALANQINVWIKSHL